MSPAADAPDAAGAVPLPPLFEGQRDALRRFVTAARAPHAVLVHGARGIGKAAVARALAASRLCTQPGDDGLGCGRCTACAWTAAGTHPDLRLTGLVDREPGKPARDISIEQIRALDDFTAMSAWGGRGRVIVVDPAHALSVEAANALLKVLEEPGEGTLFVLVTHRPDLLPATVRSRLRALHVPSPARDEALQALQQATGATPRDARRWLDHSGGAVWHAVALAEPGRADALEQLVDALASLPEADAGDVADRVSASAIEPWLPWLQRWVADLVRVAAGAAPATFPERAARLQRLAGAAGPWRLSVAAERLAQQSVLANHPLNPRLYVESTLALYRDAFR